MRDQSVGILAELTNPERCSVHSKGQCAMSELVALDQTLSDPSLDPGLAPTVRRRRWPMTSRSCSSTRIAYSRDRHTADPRELGRLAVWGLSLIHI